MRRDQLPWFWREAEVEYHSWNQKPVFHLLSSKPKMKTTLACTLTCSISLMLSTTACKAEGALVDTSRQGQSPELAQSLLAEEISPVCHLDLRDFLVSDDYQLYVLNQWLKEQAWTEQSAKKAPDSANYTIEPRLVRAQDICELSPQHILRPLYTPHFALSPTVGQN